VHGVAGAWGLLATALFADGSYDPAVVGILYGGDGRLLASAAVAVGAISVWTAVVGGTTLTGLRRLGLLQMQPEFQRFGGNTAHAGVHTTARRSRHHRPSSHQHPSAAMAAAAATVSFTRGPSPPTGPGVGPGAGPGAGPGPASEIAGARGASSHLYADALELGVSSDGPSVPSLDLSLDPGADPSVDPESAAASWPGYGWEAVWHADSSEPRGEPMSDASVHGSDERRVRNGIVLQRLSSPSRSLGGTLGVRAS